MNRKKIAEIVKFNVEKSIQNKWFVIFNIIMCIIVIISVNLKNIDKILEQNDINLFEEEFKLEIIDSNNLATGKFEEIYKDSKGVEISYITESNYTKENIPDDLIVVEFEQNDKDIVKTKIISKEATDSSLYENIKNITKQIRSEVFASRLGITNTELEKLNEEPSIEEIMLGVDAENSTTKEIIKEVSVIIVYMVLILVLSRIANEIAQEKVSKSIEYVLTSVSAKEYLLAKVLGVTITIIIQLLYSFVFYLIGNGINTIINISEVAQVSQQTTMSIDMSIVTYILAMAGYLIFTVFLMCMIQAAISAKTTSVAEASNTTTMLLMVTIVLYFISLACIGPYINVTKAMYIISCIPIVSTFFVPAMMIIGQATGLQIFVSFILLIISVPLVFNKCSEKFKNGILDYTSKSNKKRRTKKDRTIKEEQEFLMKSSKMKRFGFVIGIALLIWMILENIGSLILPTITNNLLSDVLTEKSINWIYYSIISIISLWVPSILVSSYTEEQYKEKNKLDLKSAFKMILIGWGIITIIRYLEEYILTLIGSDYNILTDNLIINSSDTILDKILFFIGLAVVPGIFEELFVRKSILNYGKQFGNYFTIIVSSIIFGLLHLNLQQGIFACLIGIVFAVIILITNDIKITIILHIMNNGLVALSSIFSESNIMQNILEYGSLALGIVGILLLINAIIKNKGQNKLFEKEKFKEEYKMIFKNFTFDLVLILFIVLTIATENYLRVL